MKISWVSAEESIAYWRSVMPADHKIYENPTNPGQIIIVNPRAQCVITLEEFGVFEFPSYDSLPRAWDED